MAPLNVCAALALAVVALALPQSTLSPRADSSECLAKAHALTTVTITNTEIIRGSPFNRENTTVSFNVANPATGVSAKCAASSVAMTPNGIGSDPYQWYDCEVAEEGKELNLKAKFQYDATLNFLTVRGSWVCDKKDKL